MGFAGLALAWREADTLISPFVSLSALTTAVSLAVFAALSALYVAKVALYPREALAEWRNPRKLNVFPSISIAFMLSAVLVLEESRDASFWLWVSGACLQVAILFRAMGTWLLRQQFELAQADPIWFFPLVGNMVAAITGKEHAPAELLWFFFCVGFFFWLMMFIIIFQRLIFHPSLPEALTPTFFILIAPPAVAFLAYYSLAGRIDVFARVLYYVALFLTLLLLANVAPFLRLAFRLSSWSYTFPLAAVTLASLSMYRELGGAWLRTGSAILLVLVTIVVFALAARTVVAAVRGEICIPDA